MVSAPDILKKYWGFDSFRPLQEEIINSVISGVDTLALLPTGGGKSICFQVPAMMKDGSCIVVSPLIALMKDQVENLRSKDISAVAITSLLSRREMDILLENSVQGAYKFIYVSPERLLSEKFRERVPHMKVSLLVVDEAHCISQWGYDFRPAYLAIAEFRKILPGVPVIALTATATPEVVTDVQKKLLFSKENVLKKSFERKNISYIVLNEQDKLSRLLKICNNIGGTGIVYTRNRRKSEELAKILTSNKIPTSFYHAGLDPVIRNERQENWLKGKTRVMVCTNAFGMGIDKPNVRFVAHMDVPETPEAYFQEAGRAGRDEKPAWAILLYNESDRQEMEDRFERSFPTIEEVRFVYQSLSNFFQVPIGSGKDTTNDFDLDTFCDRYKLTAPLCYHCLKLLEREGFLHLTENLHLPSRLMITCPRQDLYSEQAGNERSDAFVKLLLRSYPGLFDHPVYISEFMLAKRSRVSKEDIVNMLQYFDKKQLLTYFPQTGNPQITWMLPREDAKLIHIKPENLKKLKENARVRLDFVLEYASSDSLCRSRKLLAYFGETDTTACGHCDVCRANEKNMSRGEYTSIAVETKALVRKNRLRTADVVQSLNRFPEEKVITAIRELIDNNELKQDQDEYLELLAE